MIRQRVNLRTPVLGHIVAALTVVLGLLLVWYGLMVVLLAVKVSPHTVNSLSAYRSLYDDAVDLKRSDFTTLRRLIAGFAGVDRVPGLPVSRVQSVAAAVSGAS